MEPTFFNFDVMPHPCITAEYYFASRELSFEEQLQHCFLRLSSELVETVEIVKITVFAHCHGNSEYSEKLRLLNEVGLLYCPIKCPITLVSQPLADTHGLALEVWKLNTAGLVVDFQPKQFNGGKSLQVVCEDFTMLFISCHCAENECFAKNVAETFSVMDNILVDQSFSFSDVVRQWNYIENITQRNEYSLEERQNYQVFNDFRSFYYQKTSWAEGYPAATGIGMDSGGLAIEAIAVKSFDGETIKAIASPVQTDAFNYSSNVLVGAPIKEVPQITSPKFSRAKYLASLFGKTVFISGTASIIGEKTEHADDAGLQTQLTIENIRRLVTAENLQNSGINDIDSLKLLNYRVYIKRLDDFAIIQKICFEEFGDTPVLFVKADVCRNDLLVEIEANYTTSCSG